MPHQIRLAGPWEASTDDGQSWQRCTLPFPSEKSEGHQWKLRRRFHRPTGLESETAIQLIFVGTNLPNSILINGSEFPLHSTEGQISSGDIRQKLNEFNDCVISASDSGTTIVESVVLAISDPE